MVKTMLIEEHVQRAYAEASAHADHLAVFEAWAKLYEQRFGRLCPGKDDPFRNSGEPDNIVQYDAWHRSGLAKLDAIFEVIRLRLRIEADE